MCLYGLVLGCLESGVPWGSGLKAPKLDWTEDALGYKKKKKKEEDMIMIPSWLSGRKILAQLRRAKSLTRPSQSEPDLVMNQYSWQTMPND